jgi:two-component system response regulator AtoC
MKIQQEKNDFNDRMELRKRSIIAESPLMKKILEDLSKIAKSDSSVFIHGESGTGKEVIAHALHYASGRAGCPFVKVNCAAIPETLMESEFFGHEKGSFTGAIQRRTGRFELADKGTLLLDEISEISLFLQSKLLRAVQEQEFERVGGILPIKVNIRFISTSNRNMKEAVQNKQFREDLYYRLNVVPIYLPPLRERKEDIIPLAEYFLEKLSQNGKKQLSDKAKQKLLDYSWPGNIRELGNVIERTVVFHGSEVIEEISLETTALEVQKPALLSLKELEKQHILETLSSQNNNKTKTAKLLGITLRTLRNKLSEYSKSVDSSAP